MSNIKKINVNGTDYGLSTQNTLTIKQNGGNAQTFDGSTATEVNILEGKLANLITVPIFAIDKGSYPYCLEITEADNLQSFYSKAIHKRSELTTPSSNANILYHGWLNHNPPRSGLWNSIRQKLVAEGWAPSGERIYGYLFCLAMENTLYLTWKIFGYSLGIKTYPTIISWVYTIVNSYNQESDITEFPFDSFRGVYAVNRGKKRQTNAQELSFLFGNNLRASHPYGVAFGENNSVGLRGFAVGDSNKVSGESSAALGEHLTITNDYAVVVGDHNIDHSDGNNTHFIVGCDNKNGLRVTESAVYGFTYHNSGADYAEYFEWLDGNPDSEDRRGLAVTMEGEKIRKADAGEWVLGVVSGNPTVVGNSDPNGWHLRFLKDDFGTLLKQTVAQEHSVVEEVPKVITNINGEEETITEKVIKKETREKQNVIENPVFNEEVAKNYKPRATRKEWDAIGMMGVLVAVDDGTCEVNGFCTVSHDGIFTKAESGYRVTKRVNDHLIKIVIK